jgi:hypothetical protein
MWGERKIIERLDRLEADAKVEIELEKVEIDLEKKIIYQLTPRLSFIKIRFLKGETMAEGPVQLVVGQKTVASVDGFDQNGQPFLGTIPTPVYSIDQPSLDVIAPDSTNPANEDVTSLAVGVANLTATVTNAQGTVLTDTETITNVAAPQVLSSIKINFAAPGQPVVAPVKAA